MEIDIRNHSFRLLPQKALFWKNKRTLLISDLHLGKITHFRKAGIAVPQAALLRNFSILDFLIQENHVERIILLGDLFHSDINSEWELFAGWRRKYAGLELILIRGNHDVIPLRLFQSLGIEVLDSLDEDDFLFCHHPPENPLKRKFTFCGHVHPVFIVRSPAGHGTRVPCFVVENNMAVLPSFGVFTGGYSIEREYGRNIFVVAEEKVIAI